MGLSANRRGRDSSTTVLGTAEHGSLWNGKYQAGTQSGAQCPRLISVLVHKDGTAEVRVLVQWTKETVLSSQVSVTNQPFSRHCDFQCSLSLNLDVNWSHQSGGFWPRVIIRPLRSRICSVTSS